MVKVSVIELTIKWDNRCAFYRIVFYSIHTVKLCLLLGITILQEVFLLARLRMRTPAHVNPRRDVVRQVCAI